MNLLLILLIIFVFPSTLFATSINRDALSTAELRLRKRIGFVPAKTPRRGVNLQQAMRHAESVLEKAIPPRGVPPWIETFS
jgi:hypothetical protein